MVPRGPVCLNTGVRAGSISSVLLKEAIFPDVVGARADVVHTVLLTALVKPVGFRKRGRLGLGAVESK